MTSVAIETATSHHTRKRMNSYPTLVLVHGAWHRTASWRLLLDQFPDLDVQTVQLPSSAPVPVERLGDMYDDAVAIRAVVQAIDGPVVVCAHSYGGVPTSQAVEGLPQVRRLVFLSSFLLEVGTSMLANAGGRYPPHWDVHEAEGFTEICHPERVLYNDLSPERAATAVAELGPQSLKAMVQPLTKAAWRSIPSTYVIGERDAAIPPAMSKLFAGRAAEVIRLDTSHSPFLSQPRETGALLRYELSRARRS
jgi:pimeloyl-ACP methyl ester carboxylesterase